MRALLFCLLLTISFAHAQPTQPAPPKTQTYSLPPDKLQKAVDYAHARHWLYFISQIYGVGALLAILAFGLAAKFRDGAEPASRRRFIQAIIFVPLLLLANDLLNIPFAIYGQHLELIFQQSIQSWPNAKSFPNRRAGSPVHFSFRKTPKLTFRWRITCARDATISRPRGS